MDLYGTSTQSSFKYLLASDAHMPSPYPIPQEIDFKVMIRPGKVDERHRIRRAGRSQ